MKLKTIRRFAMASIFVAYVMVGGTSFVLLAQAETFHQENKESFDALFVARNVYELAQKIKESYYDPSLVTTEVILEGAFRGMLSALDPHSTYFSPKEHDEFQIQFSGSFAGVGMVLETDETTRAIKVQSVMKGMPAESAGVLLGDYLIAVREKSAPHFTPLQGLSLEKVVSIVRGTPGTVVETIIYRPSEKKRIVFMLKRDKIKIPSAEGFLLPEGIGLLNLSSFGDETCEDTEREIAKMMKADKGIKGMIINLRNNPGGSLDTAICVSDLFLDETSPEKTIVSMRGANKENTVSWNVEIIKPGDILHGVPLVVVVNGGSASASEVFAGAMQDNHRGVIAGSTTYGKGTVQNLFPMDSGGAVKITIARYYTPKGHSIQATGVVPDVVLKEYVPKDAADALPETTEADLYGHLEREESVQPPSLPPSENVVSLDKIAAEDPILFQAYGMLKGLIAAHK